VTLIRIVPERHRKLVRELVTFGAVGAINTLFGQIIFNVLLGLGALTASTISTIIATGLSYVLNRHVTYRHRPRTSLRRELPLFVGFNLIALGLQLGILAVARTIFDLQNSDRLELNIARFGGVAVGTVFLLLTYRTFVFKAEKTAPAAQPSVVDTVAALVPSQGGPGLSVVGAEHLDEFAELTDPLEAELVDAESGDPRSRGDQAGVSLPEGQSGHESKRARGKRARGKRAPADDEEPAVTSVL
jgi:putative flippase GtrA